MKPTTISPQVFDAIMKKTLNDLVGKEVVLERDNPDTLDNNLRLYGILRSNEEYEEELWLELPIPVRKPNQQRAYYSFSFDSVDTVTFDFDPPLIVLGDEVD